MRICIRITLLISIVIGVAAILMLSLFCIPRYLETELGRCRLQNYTLSQRKHTYLLHVNYTLVRYNVSRVFHQGYKNVFARNDAVDWLLPNLTAACWYSPRHVKDFSLNRDEVDMAYLIGIAAMVSIILSLWLTWCVYGMRSLYRCYRDR